MWTIDDDEDAGCILFLPYMTVVKMMVKHARITFGSTADRMENILVLA